MNIHIHTYIYIRLPIHNIYINMYITGEVLKTHTFGRPMGNLQMVEVNESNGIAR